MAFLPHVAGQLNGVASCVHKYNGGGDIHGGVNEIKQRRFHFLSTFNIELSQLLNSEILGFLLKRNLIGLFDNAHYLLLY